MRLTLRTLLAYLDDTLDPAEAKVIGQKLAESPSALELVERIRKVTRRRGLSTPPTAEQGSPSDPNTVAAYLSDALHAEQLAEFEEACLTSDVHLAEVAACHQILTLVLTEQVIVPPTAVRRMYGLVKGRESIPNRKSGKAIPVGGMPSDPKSSFDDSDAPYLLGMSAYSQSQPVALRILKWMAVAVLLVGFGIAAYMAWPVARPQWVPGNIDSAAVPTKPATEPTKPLPTVPTTPVEPMPKPVDPPVEPTPKPVDPPVEPAPDPGPPAEPQAGRIAVAKLEAADEHVLVARGAEEKEWSRIAGGGDLRSSDRLVCLPGYRTKLKFDGGLTVELWGNLPELLGYRVLETAVTLHIAPKGYDAEMTLHGGRVYFNTNKPEGAKIRVRFGKEIWDIALADAKSEAVLELTHELAPGRPPEAPQATAFLTTITGTTKLSSRGKELPPIPPKQIVGWTSKTRMPEGPRAPNPKAGEPDAAYFERSPVLPNEASARPMRAALDKFAKLLPPGKAVIDKLTETQQVEKPALNEETAAGSRFSLFAFAALGELPRIADAVNDSERGFCRMAAVVALRSALAAKPELEEALIKLAADKFRMEPAAAEKWVFRLRGFSPAERVDPEVIDAAIGGLSAPLVSERELNFFLLVNFVDPASRLNKDLMQFDAGETAERREAVARLWKRRAEDIKAALKNMPPK